MRKVRHKWVVLGIGHNECILMDIYRRIRQLISLRTGLKLYLVTVMVASIKVIVNNQYNTTTN
jgi:hypothetical protein